MAEHDLQQDEAHLPSSSGHANLQKSSVRSCSIGNFVSLALAKTGLLRHMGFQSSADAIMWADGIEPWSAKILVAERLQQQQKLAQSSPLKSVPVQVGLLKFGKRVNANGILTQWMFVETARELMSRSSVGSFSQGLRMLTSEDSALDQDRHLEQVFDAIDYDENGMLDRGEWTVVALFLKGTESEKTQAVFDMLDADGSGTLDRSEMMVYLTPLVKAMTPPQAAALRPILLQHATNEIFQSVDLNSDGKISAQEFTYWNANNSILDVLVNLIEAKVYKHWLNNRLKNEKPSQAEEKHQGHIQEPRRSSESYTSKQHYSFIS